MANRTLRQIIQPHEHHWVGNGFFVSTIFSTHTIDHRITSPFILMDHAKAKYFAPTSEKLGVGAHPHRGFETVTFAIKGEVEHRDSAGGGGIITEGGVQWMTAGSGLVHEEFHSRDFAKRGGDFEMLQLWVNLSKKDKMTRPNYQSLQESDFPHFGQNADTVDCKLIAGEFAGHQALTRTFTPMLIMDMTAKEDTTWSLQIPENFNALVFQLSKNTKLGDKTLKERDLGLTNRDGDLIELHFEAGARTLLLSGAPIEEPLVSHGPFVMNGQEEIIEAINDYHQGKMGKL